MNRTRLKLQLVKHEGLRLKPYTDTVGKLTIGVGRNLTDRGISEDEAQTLLEHDINEAWRICQVLVPGFDGLPEPQQHALLDMAFNMGQPHLATFSRMLAAVNARDFNRAAAEMLESKWATQVGARARTLAALMRTGADPAD